MLELGVYVDFFVKIFFQKPVTLYVMNLIIIK